MRPVCNASQVSATGQSMQRGERGVHHVAPKSIIAWLKADAWPGGKSSVASDSNVCLPRVVLMGTSMP